jgi:predicted RNase H-like HicB family nuclease
MTYTVVLVHEPEGGYSVHVPALPGCHTQGEDVPEALWMAEDAIRLYVESLVDRGLPVPADLGTVPVGLEDAAEAAVMRVTVREAAGVA